VTAHCHPMMPVTAYNSANMTVLRWEGGIRDLHILSVLLVVLPIPGPVLQYETYQGLILVELSRDAFSSS
jgi:hypothetical protein